VFTAHATDEYVIAALKAGALGYVLKNASHTELIKGLRAVSVGQMFLCVCASTETRILRPVETPTGANGHTLITQRERDVLEGIAQGKRNKDIAQALLISVKTVEKHRGNLMRKLNVHNSAELTIFALHHGLVSTRETGESRLRGERPLNTPALFRVAN
jgi:DNA-binding NarL/FixJ family response regulator